MRALWVTQDSLRILEQHFNSPNPWNEDADFARGFLGQSNWGLANPESYFPSYFVGAGYTANDNNSVGKLLDFIEPLTTQADPDIARTANFLNAKLHRLREMMENHEDGSGTYDSEPYMQTGVMTPGILSAAFDGLATNPTTTVLGDLNALRLLVAGDLRNYTFDAIGTSYFKGVVYTNGAFLAENEVQVMGGLYVDKTELSPSTPLASTNGALPAGSVSLEGGSRLVYVESLLEESASSSDTVFLVPTLWLTP